MCLPLKIDMTLEEYIEMKEFTHIGGDYYLDAGGGCYHETNIEDEMKAEMKAFKRKIR